MPRWNRIVIGRKNKDVIREKEAHVKTQTISLPRLGIDIDYFTQQPRIRDLKQRGAQRESHTTSTRTCWLDDQPRPATRTQPARQAASSCYQSHQSRIGTSAELRSAIELRSPQTSDPFDRLSHQASRLPACTFPSASPWAAA
jgi:hypothetical protein